MAYKIYVENNHIVVQDLVSDKEFRAASKEALFFKDKVSEDIYNTNGFFPEGLQGIKFSDIVDENNNPFADEQTFINFFSTNTGNFNSGGATPQVKEAVYYIAGQDETGFLGVVEKSNNTSTTFEFVRVDIGNFTCTNFDPVKHFIFSAINRYNAKVSFEDGSISTINNISQSDGAYSFGGILIIREI